jgi:hypothetical protein
VIGAASSPDPVLGLLGCGTRGRGIARIGRRPRLGLSPLAED